MKSKALILILTFISLLIGAQPVSHSQLFQQTTLQGNSYSADQLFSSAIEEETDEYDPYGERLNIYNSGTFTQPSPPLLTTNPGDLEICTGNSTRLTANSNHLVYWYTTPPPLGTPVGIGASYITPVLTTGYYTYYAIAEHDGIKSDITAMEVVMVYPTPTIDITSNASSLCANETATLLVSGTTYYEWENGPVSSHMTIRPKQTQTYKVTGINTAGCKSTATYTQRVENCLPAEGEDAANTNQSAADNKQMATESFHEDHKLFSVFPNPNNGEFNIRVNSISESTRVEVYNCLGQLTYGFKVSNEISSVILTDSPNGIYIVRILENDKVLKQQKIVKE